MDVGTDLSFGRGLFGFLLRDILPMILNGIVFMSKHDMG
jgi:hypothetical protein